jgi:hypothetical protein
MPAGCGRVHDKILMYMNPSLRARSVVGGRAHEAPYADAKGKSCCTLLHRMRDAATKIRSLQAIPSPLLGQAVLVCLTAVLAALAGCGGGGGGGTSSPSSGGATSGSMKLAWSPVAGAAGYAVYYRTPTENYTYPVDVGMATLSGSDVTYTLTGLTVGQTYSVVVTAYDASKMQSSPSNEAAGVAR